MLRVGTRYDVHAHLLVELNYETIFLLFVL